MAPAVVDCSGVGSVGRRDCLKIHFFSLYSDSFVLTCGKHCHWGLQNVACACMTLDEIAGMKKSFNLASVGEGVGGRSRSLYCYYREIVIHVTWDSDYFPQIPPAIFPSHGV